MNAPEELKGGQAWGDLEGKFEAFDEVKWSDLKAKSEAAAKKEAANRARALEDDELVQEENGEMLQDYKVPNLQLRMDICTNFPIVVRKCPDRDVERYALEWNRKQYDCFRQTTATTMESHMHFDYHTVWRLIYSLRLKHTLYKIEAPRSKEEICVIAMQAAPLSEAVIRSTKQFMLTKGVQIPSVKGFPECEALRTPPSSPKAATPKAAAEPKAPTPKAAAEPKAPTPKAAAAKHNTRHNNHKNHRNHRTRNNRGSGSASASSSVPYVSRISQVEDMFPVKIYYDRERDYHLVDVDLEKARRWAEHYRMPLREYGPDMERKLIAVLKHSDAWVVYEPKGANDRYIAVLKLRR